MKKAFVCLVIIFLILIAKITFANSVSGGFTSKDIILTEVTSKSIVSTDLLTHNYDKTNLLTSIKNYIYQYNIFNKIIYAFISSFFIILVYMFKIKYSEYKKMKDNEKLFDKKLMDEIRSIFSSNFINHWNEYGIISYIPEKYLDKFDEYIRAMTVKDKIFYDKNLKNAHKEFNRAVNLLYNSLLMNTDLDEMHPEIAKIPNEFRRQPGKTENKTHYQDVCEELNIKLDNFIKAYNNFIYLAKNKHML